VSVNRILLALAIFFLTVWGVTMLVLRGTVAFALGDTDPISVQAVEELPPRLDRLARVDGTPNHGLSVVFWRYGVYSYWYPLEEHGRRVIVKSDSPLRRSAGQGAQTFEGRLRPIEGIAFSSRVINLFLQERGLTVYPGSYVLDVSESPQLFRPMVLMAAPVTLAWLVVLAIVLATGVRALARRRTGPTEAPSAVNPNTCSTSP
jgi:hypothetical protein